MSWATRGILAVSAAALFAVGGYAEAQAAEVASEPRYAVQVRAELDLTAAGTVADCRMRDPATPPHIAGAACALMRSSARFTPPLDVNGKPIPATVVQTISFRQY
jgi:hypothetical protein